MVFAPLFVVRRPQHPCDGTLAHEARSFAALQGSLHEQYRFFHSAHSTFAFPGRPCAPNIRFSRFAVHIVRCSRCARRALTGALLCSRSPLESSGGAHIGLNRSPLGLSGPGHCTRRQRSLRTGIARQVRCGVRGSWRVATQLGSVGLRARWRLCARGQQQHRSDGCDGSCDM